jgi:hypothetical protein
MWRHTTTNPQGKKIPLGGLPERDLAMRVLALGTDIPIRGCVSRASLIGPRLKCAPCRRRRQHRRKRIVTPPEVMEERG